MPVAAWVLLAGLALAATVPIGGCGGGEGSDSTRTATVLSDGGPGAPGSRSSAPARRRAPAGTVCRSQLGTFVGSMDALRRRLAVGVTFDQYVDEVNGIRAIYRRIPVDRLRIDCLNSVGALGEKALNRYIEAANEWGDCVSEAGCGSATVEPVLQRRWRIASGLLSEAQRGLQQTEN